MSVIVAVRENGVVYMGADSQTSVSRRKYSNFNETSFKVKRLQNGILVGFCGRVTASQIILSMRDVFTLDENERLTKKHIVEEIIPKLSDKMEEIGDEEGGAMEVSILLAHKDALYRINSNLDVVRQTEYASSGAGLPYVQYVLAERKDLPVRERLLQALMESARRTESVSGPYVLIDTDKLEYEVVDMGGENY